MGNVMVIPARRQVGNNIKKAEKPKLRVAAYCRVSTDSDEQATRSNTTRSTFPRIQIGCWQAFLQTTVFPAPTQKSATSLTA